MNCLTDNPLPTDSNENIKIKMEERLINGETSAMSSNAVFKFWFSPCGNFLPIHWAQFSVKPLFN